jgi:hypothetical protein
MQLRTRTISVCYMWESSVVPARARSWGGNGSPGGAESHGAAPQNLSFASGNHNIQKSNAMQETDHRNTNEDNAILGSIGDAR